MSAGPPAGTFHQDTVESVGGLVLTRLLGPGRTRLIFQSGDLHGEPPLFVAVEVSVGTRTRTGFLPLAPQTEIAHPGGKIIDG